jgi:hypothetical protein
MGYSPVKPGKVWEETVTKPQAVTGVVCRECKDKNDFAEPNQPDGSYICFGCR